MSKVYRFFNAKTEEEIIRIWKSMTDNEKNEVKIAQDNMDFIMYQTLETLAKPEKK